jgi:hypothetical protein
MLAAQKGHLEVVKCLVHAEARTGKENNVCGKTFCCYCFIFLSLV